MAEFFNHECVRYIFCFIIESNLLCYAGWATGSLL